MHIKDGQRQLSLLRCGWLFFVKGELETLKIVFYNYILSQRNDTEREAIPSVLPLPWIRYRLFFLIIILELKNTLFYVQNSLLH